MLSYLAHRRDCKSKQASRAAAIASLPPAYHTPLTPTDATILNSPVSTAASHVRAGTWKPIDILRAYGKRAIYAHEQTNCLTEILIPTAEEWLSHSTAGPSPNPSTGINLNGPLAGIPVSLKDTVNVAGYDSCIGYSKYVNRPATSSAPLIHLLRDAGAVPFVKTNVPITLLSFECTNDVFGRTDNPHVRGYSPGGSTGGESALLALGGSRIGVGTDVAGSVRVPAHYSGIYTIRCSTGRFPRWGNTSSMSGQEGVPAVYSPMTRTMPDLTYFLHSIIDMKPWDYDHTVIPLPWRDVSHTLSGKARWGVIRDDGVVPPSPPCARALDTVITALKSQGEHITELTDFPAPLHALRTAAHLLNSDGGATLLSHFRSLFERNDPGVAQMILFFRLPRVLKTLYVFYVRYILRDAVWAGLLKDWSARSACEQWELVAEREGIRSEWHEYRKRTGVDFILMVPNALPAVPEGGMKNGFKSCGYTFLWNLVDYAAGVLPVTVVDRERDGLEVGWMGRLGNGVARAAYRDYDEVGMHGLPVGVQVVAGRLEEERCLWAMERVVECLDVVGEGWREGVIEAE